MGSNSAFCFCPKQLYKNTILQGIILSEIKGFNSETSQDINILVKSDCPGEMLIKAQATQINKSSSFNKGEKILLKVKKIGLIQDGSIEYKPFEGKIISINGIELNGDILNSDESYKGAVKRALKKSKDFALYPVNCYQLAHDYSNSPFSPLLLLMEPFYFVLGIFPAVLSPATAIFQEGEKANINRQDMAEIKVLEDIKF